MQEVSVFQRNHILNVKGIAEITTWEAIVPIYDLSLTKQNSAVPIEVVWNPDSVIKAGGSHPNLFLAQGMLAVLSEVYHSVSKPALTGILDEITADSLSSFQMLAGLPMTGNLDRATWTHLSWQYPLAANQAVSQCDK